MNGSFLNQTQNNNTSGFLTPDALQCRVKESAQAGFKLTESEFQLLKPGDKIYYSLTTVPDKWYYSSILYCAFNKDNGSLDKIIVPGMGKNKGKPMELMLHEIDTVTLNPADSMRIELDRVKKQMEQVLEKQKEMRLQLLETAKRVNEVIASINDSKKKGGAQ